ncbi:hypothetical protein V2I52_08505 [Brenneria sp. g21c3]|uniref:hypothetical protein n=1 Tax=Brenneria sp. g21c3 TaxID=3093893 RepID=UPI002EBB8DA3|nr:hypothetical protein [Brenneria sp. g21c3]
MARGIKASILACLRKKSHDLSFLPGFVAQLAQKSSMLKAGAGRESDDNNVIFITFFDEKEKKM